MKIMPEMFLQSDVATQARKQAKLADAAQQFEASMLQELLKPLQSNYDSWGGEDSGDDNSLDTIRGFGTEAVAKAISGGGGFGIARQVISQVNRETQQNAHNRTSGH